MENNQQSEPFSGKYANVDSSHPIWGKQGEWVSYNIAAIQKELEETKKKLSDAEAELAKEKQLRLDFMQQHKPKGNLMAQGLKACAEVSFIPKTP